MLKSTNSLAKSAFLLLYPLGRHETIRILFPCDSFPFSFLVRKIGPEQTCVANPSLFA